MHSSDSGADISEQNLLDKHHDHHHLRKTSKSQFETESIKELNETEQEHFRERNNSLPDIFCPEEQVIGWDKYWAKNGEQLIWASWIEKYSDYINPEYFETNDAQARQFSFEPQDVEMVVAEASTETHTEILISPCSPAPISELLGDGWNPLSPASVDDTYHKQSKTEVDTLLSPRCESVNSSIPFTTGDTDSMTNVTKMTNSSYDFCRYVNFLVSFNFKFF